MEIKFCSFIQLLSAWNSIDHKFGVHSVFWKKSKEDFFEKPHSGNEIFFFPLTNMVLYNIDPLAFIFLSIGLLFCVQDCLRKRTLMAQIRPCLFFTKLIHFHRHFFKKTANEITDGACFTYHDMKIFSLSMSRHSISLMAIIVSALFWCPYHMLFSNFQVLWRGPATKIVRGFDDMLQWKIFCLKIKP